MFCMACFNEWARSGSKRFVSSGGERRSLAGHDRRPCGWTAPGAWRPFYPGEPEQLRSRHENLRGSAGQACRDNQLVKERAENPLQGQYPKHVPPWPWRRCYSVKDYHTTTYTAIPDTRLGRDLPQRPRGAVRSRTAPPSWRFLSERVTGAKRGPSRIGQDARRSRHWKSTSGGIAPSASPKVCSLRKSKLGHWVQRPRSHGNCRALAHNPKQVGWGWGTRPDRRKRRAFVHCAPQRHSAATPLARRANRVGWWCLVAGDRARPERWVQPTPGW